MKLTITLTGAFLFFSARVNSQGYNGCYSSTWGYHSHTHTCVNLVRQNQTWDHAQKDCRSFKGGTKENIPGHLAKIGDRKTNEFLRNFMRTFDRGWIGLHYVRKLNTTRWDAFPDQKISYTRLRSSALVDFLFSTKNYDFYTLLTGHGEWQKVTDGTRKHYYYCQHDARIERTRMSCPDAPIEESTPLTNAVTSQFHFNHWDKIRWYLDSNGQRVAQCTRSSHACKSFAGYAATVTSSGLATLSLIGRPILRPISKWTFSIVHRDHRRTLPVETKVCNVAIYAKPSPLKCRVDLLSSEINVACETDRVYPRASCDWSYKNEADDTFHSIDQSQQQDIGYKNIENKNVYFKSACSVTLTPDKTTIKNGMLVVRIQVYPQVKRHNLSQTPEAKQMKEMVLNIVSPEMPTFWSSNKTLPISNPLLVLDGDTLTLECRIDSGSPELMSTHMACDFPFPSSNGSTDSVPGASYSKTFTVNTAMNGKTCRCWGVHITGDTEIRELSFSVTAPVDIVHFLANGQSSRLVVSPGSKVNISCHATGFPPPKLEILKMRSAKTEINLQTVEDNIIDVALVASCLDNDRYQCRAHSSVGQEAQSPIMDLDIDVMCMPYPCDSYRSTPASAWLPGTQANVTLCAVAYPLPDSAKFQLQKDTNGQWIEVQRSNYTLAIEEGRKDTLARVKIAFRNFNLTDVGHYRLYYPPEKDMSYSYLYFQITEQEVSKLSQASGLGIGLVLGITGVIIIVIFMVVITTFVCRRLHGIETGQKQRTQDKVSHKGRPAAETGVCEAPKVNDQEGYEDVSLESFPKAEAKKMTPDPSKEDPKTKLEEEGDEYELMDDVHEDHYELIEDKPEDSHYDILHKDDPTYTNLNRESRVYMKVEV